jgi:hypothetical protein
MKTDIVWRVRNWRENALLWLVWRLPRPVAYWAFIRVATDGCNGNPAEQTCGDALKRHGDWYR